MDRKQSVKYAIGTMEMEGHKYTQEEKAMWNKIAAGELPLSTAKDQAEAFDRVMRSQFPEKYAVAGDE